MSASADSTPVLTVDDAGCATLTLNRPRHHNRLHRADLQALQQHFSDVAADPALRVLVLTGSGASFCSGFHLGELAEAGAGEDPQAFEHMVDALEALSLPTVARLNGGVYGGATDLALACDFRIGVDGMRLRMPAARLGLHYYPSGLRRFTTRLGLQAAKRLFLLAETVNAATLLRIGYLDECVASEALDEAVARCVAALMSGAAQAVQGMKTSLNEIARGDATDAALREREARCAASADLREGLAAQAEGRHPTFRGR